ncbi:MAG: OST-HTH/LOTUS domain-containing protein, partial [Gammaproteobacteria bacterium]|nr:OST-HTH/LOTUS domain-containing protein [Gammaproteobacteria bacterium]
TQCEQDPPNSPQTSRVRSIGSHVRSAHPEFDPRTYGFRKLVDLIEQAGQFEVKRNEVPVRARMKRLQ